MKGEAELLESERESAQNSEPIEAKQEEGADEQSELGLENLLEPEENFFSRRLPTINIAKGGYYIAKPEDWFLSSENDIDGVETHHRNFGLEIGAGAVIGAVGAHAFDPTGLYTQALSDPDPVNIAIAGSAGLVGNSIAGALYGGIAGGVQNVARGMAGVTLAASGATYSFMTNNVLRGLEQAEKYLRDNQESELADTAVCTFDKLTAEAEAFYDRIRSNDKIETYSPRDLDELEDRFSELERYGEIRELETPLQILTDKSEFSDLVDYLQNEDEVEFRDEDIQVEERQEGRLATYRGRVELVHKIDGEPYRDESLIEFEAVVNKSDMGKIDF